MQEEVPWCSQIFQVQSLIKNFQLKEFLVFSYELFFCYLYFLITMLLIGFFCLYQLNVYTWFVAISAMPLIIIYPLAKKFTKWPQVFLGLTFSWAVPTAWSSANEEWNLGVFF